MPERSLEELSREELVEELRSLRARWHEAMTDRDGELSRRHAVWSSAARLYEDTPLALLMLDDKGVVQHANRSAAQLLGKSRPALVGKPFIVAAPMRDAAPFWRHLQRCLSDGQPVATEIDLLRGAESRRVELTIGPSTEPSTGRPIVATALVDIERHLDAQREVRRAHDEERRIRARLEAQGRASAAIGEAQAAMHRHGVRSVLEAIAEQARHLVDAEMAALGIGGAPGQPFDHWVESGVSEEVHAAIGRGPPPRVGVLDRVALGSVIRTPDVTRHPGFRGRLPAGHPPVTSFLGVPVRHRDRPMGNLYVANKRAAAGFDEDDERSLSLLGEYAALVIESAMATDAEIRERTRLRAIIDQLPESVIVKDSHSHIIPNAKALSLAVDSGGRVDPLGNPIQWDLRRPDGTTVPWEDLPLTRAFRQREATFNVELAVATADGRLIPILVNAAPLVDASGQPLGAVAVWHEIEQLKRLERLREEWAAVVAHDLRQPLAIIRTWDQVLAHGGDLGNERCARAVRTIDRSAVRMNEMLEELIDTSLLEANRLTLHTDSLRLEELVRESVEVMPVDDRALYLEVEPELPEVEADRARLARVIENLISNAIKYGRPGTDVVVSVARRPAGVEVAVTNAGKELTPADIQRLFSRFYRASTAGSKRGLGLGLYIAQGIVTAHGGRLECESRQGRTTFRFTIPRQPPATIEPPPPAPA